MNRLVTLWSLDIGDGPEFNHLSLGYNPDHEAPAYVSQAQHRAWAKGIWTSLPAELVNNTVRPLHERQA